MGQEYRHSSTCTTRLRESEGGKEKKGLIQLPDCFNTNAQIYYTLFSIKILFLRPRMEADFRLKIFLRIFLGYTCRSIKFAREYGIFALQ